MNKSSSKFLKIPPWVIFHVPHDSTLIPSELRNQFLLDDQRLSGELIKMTDHHTFGLISLHVPGNQIVRFPVSRLVVDVERFESDQDEPMAARGMGVIYESTHELGSLRRPLTDTERENLLSNWYRPHHQLLTDKVGKVLDDYDCALVVDVHSFPSQPLPYETDLTAYRPEICIGSDSFHSSAADVEALARRFEAHGFEVGINTPFAGALVPIKYYKQDKRVRAVMIEIRRDIYLHEQSAFPRDNWDQIKIQFNEILIEWLMPGLRL